jgi:glucose/arabinose dehydrogenase
MDSLRRKVACMLDRRTLLAGAAAGAAAGTALPLLGATAADAAPRVSRVLAGGLEIPWGLAFLPSGDALVAERYTGRVYRVDRRGGKRLVGELEVDAVGEGGLLGIAIAPTFAADRWVYFYRTRRGANQILRKRYRGDELGRTRGLLGGIPANNNHNGGRLAFGPDGHLYAGTGDAGRGFLAQDRRSLGGKILRLTPDGRVPTGNPFDSYVWSYGHRNVQGLAWDGRGRMWAAELGQNTHDELNRIRPGRNYGWPRAEGNSDDPDFTDPFVTWRPEVCSPSGVAVVGGRAWVGALRGRSLWSVRLGGPNARNKVRHLHEEFGRIRTVERAPDGSLWITTSNRDGRGEPRRGDDKVVRLVV